MFLVDKRSSVLRAKEVLCTTHWSKQPEIFDINIDVPDVKFPARGAESDKNWYWNCSGVLCNNSWRTKDRNGAKLKHYKLSGVAKDKGLKAAYDKILKNKKTNWKKGVTCSEHWSKGFRSSLEDPPDRSTTPAYAQSQPSYITPPRNIASAKRCLIDEGKEPKSRRKIKRLDPKDPKDEIIETVSKENSELKTELLILKQKLRQKKWKCRRWPRN